VREYKETPRLSTSFFAKRDAKDSVCVVWPRLMLVCRLVLSAECSSVLPSIAAIEAQVFPSPWGSASLAATLAQPGTLLAVAETDSRHIVSYCLCQQVLDEATLFEIATASDFQRQGLAARLLRLCAETLSRTQCATLWLEVRKGNTSAIALYEKVGFQTQGLRKRYYPPLFPDGDFEDAVLMSCSLPSCEPKETVTEEAK